MFVLKLVVVVSTSNNAYLLRLSHFPTGTNNRTAFISWKAADSFARFTLGRLRNRRRHAERALVQHEAAARASTAALAVAEAELRRGAVH